ncbi:MAG: hypothetical protein KJS90_01500 [Acidobacteria bacterium]|nr:hypothetical protein [Acidobacteriota bacterium]
MNRARLFTGLFALILPALLASCASPEQEAVRPLVNLEGTELYVAKYDDASLQERLGRLVGEVAPLARTNDGWGNLDTDTLNPEISDIVFIGSERATLNFGYGTEATSMLSREDHVIFVAAGDTGTCWGIRISGAYADPQVVYGNVFAPNCSADQLADHALLPCSTAGGCPDETVAENNGRVWYPTWPPTAKPTATGPEGIEVGEPPAPGNDG